MATLALCKVVPKAYPNRATALPFRARNSAKQRERHKRLRAMDVLVQFFILPLWLTKMYFAGLRIYFFNSLCGAECKEIGSAV